MQGAPLLAALPGALLQSSMNQGPMLHPRYSFAFALRMHLTCGKQGDEELVFEVLLAPTLQILAL